MELIVFCWQSLKLNSDPKIEKDQTFRSPPPHPWSPQPPGPEVMKGLISSLEKKKTFLTIIHYKTCVFLTQYMQYHRAANFNILSGLKLEIYYLFCSYFLIYTISLYFSSQKIKINVYFLISLDGTSYNIP
jgi:hypothetical protein